MRRTLFILGLSVLLAGCASPATVAASPSETPPPLPSATLAPSATPDPTATPTALPTATPTPQGPLMIAVEDLPAAAQIEEISGRGQLYPLSCESRSAADLAAFWNIEIEEGLFFSQLPKSDDPDQGFVGNLFGEWGFIPPNPYGVHAAPVAALLREYGLVAEAHKGLTWDDLRVEIASGRPVEVWLTGHVWLGAPKKYTAPNGNVTTVAHYEHTMLLVGYGEDHVTLINASNGERDDYPLSNFLVSWGALDNMALTVTGVDMQSKLRGPYDGTFYTLISGDNLVTLADLWGIHVVDLIAMNEIVYPFTVYPGQVLKTGLPNRN